MNNAARQLEILELFAEAAHPPTDKNKLMVGDLLHDIAWEKRLQQSYAKRHYEKIKSDPILWARKLELKRLAYARKKAAKMPTVELSKEP